MGPYHPVAEEQFWSHPEKVWKRNCLGPTVVSQGESSLRIEHLSHSGHDANQDSEWGACGVTRPKPAAQLVIGVMLAKAAQSVPRACIMHRHFGLSVADAIPPIA